jgi:phosphatidylinositol alpha-1,6-mannosyltransferase
VRRLTVLTPDFPPAIGGIQRSLARLSTGLAGSWSVTVITSGHPDAPRRELLEGVTIWRTRSRWGGPRSAAVLAEMLVMTRAAPADAVIVGHAVMTSVAVAARPRTPKLAIFHGSELWAPVVQASIQRFGGALSVGVAVSRFTAEEAARAGFPEGRMQVIGWGADKARAPADADVRVSALGLKGARYLLTVSRLVEPHKGHDAMLRVLPALAARHPDLRYVIAGDGPLERHFRRVAAASEAHRSVVWAGAVSDDTRRALMAHARAFVMISRTARAAAAYEGFGLVYLEAAALGRPSIAGKSGGAPDAVKNEQTGLLVDPEEPIEIVEAADRLLQDAQFADRLGAAARVHASRFTWEACVNRYDEILTELVRE